ncbi:MAG: hypothetical protein DMG12_01220 [Acidobacteria bacterium]|nr:MAG: hypothetical protein DMG12_01220 [Acidobacteriota bacterium]
MKRLEKELGQRLFDRSPARYRHFYRGRIRSRPSNLRPRRFYHSPTNS